MLAFDLADPPTAADPAAPALPADIGFRFTPMLDVRKGVINTFQCEPWLPPDGGGARTGYDVLPPEENDALTGALDCGQLEAALTGLRGLLRRGEVAVIATAIHCRSIETTGPRRALLSLLETVTPAEKRLLAIVLCGLPDGAPTARIGYAVGFLQRFCRVVTVLRPLKAPHADRLEGTGAFGMNLAVDPALPAEQAIAGLGDFIKAADRNHLKALVSGLSTPMLVAHAMLSGYSHVAGEGLLAPRPEPEGIRRFACDDFLRQLGTRKADA